MLLVDASADGSLVDRRIASLDGVFLYTAADLAAICLLYTSSIKEIPQCPRKLLWR